MKIKTKQKIPKRKFLANCRNMYKSRIFNSKSYEFEIISISKIAACIAVNNLAKLEKILKFASRKGIRQEAVYETILQSYLFCGFPPVIEAMKLFRKYFPNLRISQVHRTHSQIKKSGEANCKLIYGKNYKKLIENMHNLSPDLKEWMIKEGYGKVFGREGVTLVEREFVNVSLLTSRYFENQLHSHIRGCLNAGAAKEEICFLLRKIREIAGAKNTNKSLALVNTISS